MFILVLQQCHKENEDKWKRLSRQIADVILPMISKQQVGQCVLMNVFEVTHQYGHYTVHVVPVVCCVLTDASGLSGGVGSVEHSV